MYISVQNNQQQKKKKSSQVEIVSIGECVDDQKTCKIKQVNIGQDMSWHETESNKYCRSDCGSYGELEQNVGIA